METICFEDTKQGSIFYSVKSIRISNFLIAHSGGLAGKHLASHTGDWGLIPGRDRPLLETGESVTGS